MTSHNMFASRPLRITALGVVVAAALALSGCNSGGDPNTGGTTSSSATVTESTTPKMTSTPTSATETSPAREIAPPKLPIEAGEETKDGVEIFAKYYVELLEYAYTTGDVRALEVVNSPSCKSCSGPVGDVKNAYSAGGWVVGGDLEATAASSSFLRSADGSYFVNLSIKQGRTAYYSGPRVLRKDVPAPEQEAPMQLTASFVDGAWQVEDFSPPKGL